jgi:hypothetical protein
MTHIVQVYDHASKSHVQARFHNRSKESACSSFSTNEGECFLSCLSPVSQASQYVEEGLSGYDRKFQLKDVPMRYVLHVTCSLPAESKCYVDRCQTFACFLPAGVKYS